MSHIVVVETKIRNPNKNIAKRALELVAKKYGGEILETNVARDLYVTVTGDFLARIKGRVVGVKADKTLEIVGDPYNWEDEFEKIRDEIEKTYVMVAVTVAMEMNNYTLTEVNDNKESVTMLFVRG